MKTRLLFILCCIFFGFLLSCSDSTDESTTICTASSSDELTIEVQPDNTPPIVDAGPDQTISVSQAATLIGTVTDDGLPDPPGTVLTTWSQVSGPGLVTFADASSAATTATVSEPGTYVIRIGAKSHLEGAFSRPGNALYREPAAQGHAHRPVLGLAQGDRLIQDLGPLQGNGESQIHEVQAAGGMGFWAAGREKGQNRKKSQ